jgi:hypothetical protein
MAGTDGANTAASCYGSMSTSRPPIGGFEQWAGAEGRGLYAENDLPQEQVCFALGL